MRIYARKAGVLDGITKCADCGGPMVKVGIDYRCMDKVEAEELVATGFIPSKGADGKLHFESTAKDQQSLQITQALSGSEELDDAYLQSLGLNLDKIRQFQIKHGLVP
jgi:recombinational DNA repair protein (RecF pathway)